MRQQACFPYGALQTSQAVHLCVQMRFFACWGVPQSPKTSRPFGAARQHFVDAFVTYTVGFFI